MARQRAAGIDSPAPSTDPKNLVRSLEKGFRVLESFGAAEPELTLADAARRAGLDNATAFRLLPYGRSTAMLTTTTTPCITETPLARRPSARTIYANDGAAYDATNRCRWKIVTTANCSYYTPYVSPWMDAYHSGTSEISPYLEILRSGSTMKYQNDEVLGRV